jgi:hypothetical protein
LPEPGRSALFHFLGELEQPLGGVRTTIQQHVFDVPAQLRRDFLVDAELAGIDDAHVQAGANRVIEKGRMHRFAHGIVAAIRK